jgi:hypothetical protein
VQFITSDTTVVEGTAGTLDYTLGFDPTTHVSTNLQVHLTSVNAVYGIDYTTTPDGSSGTITIPVGVNDAAATFTVTVLDDGFQEGTESIQFAPIALAPGTFAINNDSLRTLTIADDDASPTVLEPGDLVVLGVNTSNASCGGTNGEDVVSFMCFKDITTGTSIILTDNGYSRCTPGLWGNSEGTVSMQRVGTTIPAGQVITFKVHNFSGTGNVASAYPDAYWSCTQLNHPAGSAITFISLNNGGDQLFFMQGGTWSSGNDDAQDATYDGTVLYGISTNNSWDHDCASNKHSDLPPGLSCFSLALEGPYTDFNKYTGSLSAKTQYDWVLATENPTNWGSYSDCTDYNSAAPDLTTAPILPILPGGVTSGLWRGGKNTDWFDCKNWDDSQVPDATTDVTINESTFNNCTVGVASGLSPAGTAECASLMLTSGSVASPSLDIQPNSTLHVDGPFTIQRSAGNGPLIATVGNGALVTATNLLIGSSNSGSNEALFNCDQTNSQARFSGNVTIGDGGLLDMQGGISDSLFVGGHFSNLQDETKFLDQGSVTVLNGTADQTIGIATGTEYFDSLWIDKPSGKVVLESPIRIRGALDLTSGIVEDTLAGTLVTLEASAVALHPSNASYVNGPVQKFGNADFTFPTGEMGYYRPCGLQEITGTSADAFTAEYFMTNPENTIGPLAQPTTLDHISHVEYWDIQQSIGNASARVILSWNTAASQGVTVPADLRVAHWDAVGGNWSDRGMSEIQPNGFGGLIAEANLSSSFSPWTLGSISSNNPLPIELLSFTATPVNHVVDLAWSTASEQDNDHFTVERSADAEHFEEVLRTPGASNSQQVLHYDATDMAPLPGHSYYRLRQTDLDGSSTLSPVVPVVMDGGETLTVIYGDERPAVRNDFPAGASMTVRDGTGRVLAQARTSGPGLARIPVEGLAHGVYLLQLTDGGRAASTRFVY